MALALVLVAIPVLSSCAPEAKPVSPAPVAPEAEENWVKFGWISALTSPYAACYTGGLACLQDHFGALNEAGGIGKDNVKVEILWTDYKFDVPKGLATWDRFKADPKVIAMGCYWSGLASALVPKAEKDQVPMIGFAVDDAFLFPPRWYFLTHATGSTWVLTALQGFEKYVWDREKMGRGPKVALIQWDVSFTYTSTPGFKQYFKDNGWELVYEAIVPPRQTDFTIEAAKVKESGAEVVTGILPGTACGMCIRDLGKAGLFPDLTYLGTAFNMTDSFLRAGEGYLDNVVGSHMAISPEAPYPIVDTLVERQIAKWGNIEDYWIDYLYGYLLSSIIHQALERAVDDVGYDGLTSVTFKEQGLEGLPRWDTGVGLSLSYNDYPGDRQALGETFFSRWNPETHSVEPLTPFPIPAEDWLSLTPEEVDKWIKIGIKE